MRKASWIFVSLIFLVSLGCRQQAVIDTEAEKMAITGLLEDYVSCVESEDLEQYGMNVVHDPDVVNFGAFGPPIIGWEELEQVIAGQNEMLSDISIDMSDIRIELAKSGDLAWATSLWNFKAKMGEDQMELPVRCTWILEKHQDRWLIKHFHKSVAAG